MKNILLVFSLFTSLILRSQTDSVIINKNFDNQYFIDFIKEIVNDFVLRVEEDIMEIKKAISKKNEVSTDEISQRFSRSAKSSL